MDDWQLETLVAAILAGPRSPDIVDKLELILAQIRERGGLRTIHERARQKTDRPEPSPSDAGNSS